MALPSHGTLGQVVAYNGYNYQWNGTGWINIGQNSVSIGNTAISNSGLTTGNTSVNVSINSNGTVTTGNTTIGANGITSGNVSINSNGSITTGNTSISSNGITSGNVSINSNGSITTGNTSISSNGITSGNVSINSNGTITSGNTTINGNNITTGNSSVNVAINSNGTVTTGNTVIGSNSITTSNGVVNVSISSNGTITTGNSVTNTSITSNNISTLLVTLTGSPNATVNSTIYTGTANNTLYVGSVDAADVVSNAQLQANLASYQLTASMAGYAATNGATFTGELSVTNNFTVTGNLVVTGTTLFANVTNLDVSDKNITIAKGAPSASAADGAGLTVDGAQVGWYYNKASNTWQSNVGITPSANVSFDIGSAGLTWSNVYSNNLYGTLQTASQPNITANNTTYVGTVTAANVVSNSQLQSNLANYQTTAGLSANVATLTANNTSFVGSVSAANVVSNAQLQSNLANYQTTAGMSAYQTTDGLASNVATLTANNTSFVGSIDAANVVSNAQLQANLANYETLTNLTANYPNNSQLSANLANYQTTAGLSANVATLTANNTSFVGTVSAANVVSNSQLQSNLANYQTTAGMSAYQTTAGLSANVATLTANNTSFVGTVSAANVVSNAQLQANLANYETLSDLQSNYTNNASLIIKQLNDVSANGATAGQVLTYSTSLSKWINQDPQIATPVYVTGYYGSYYDLTNQTVSAANTATVLHIGNTYFQNGITIGSNDNISFAYTGVYSIEYSIQFTSSSNKNEDIYVWIRKNGTDIPESASEYGIYPVNDSANGYIIAVSPYIDNVSAGDKYQIMWAASSTDVSAIQIADTTFSPNVPSVIVTITPVADIISKPAGTNTQIQFNDNGVANATGAFTFDKTTNSVFVSNALFVNGVVNAASLQLDSLFVANSAGIYFGNSLSSNPLSIDVTDITFGNTTSNLTVNSSLLFIGNSSSNSVITQNTISIGNVFSANSLSISHSANLVLNSNAGIIANGSIGSAGQLLYSNGSSVYWANQPSANVNAQYTWTNTQTFTNTVTFNSIINGTANNTSFVGTVSAANVVSNAQLQANLSNYQTTAGLSANVATLTANNANNLGGVPASSYVNTTGSYTISGIQTFSSNLILQAGLSANGTYGTANQVLTSNGSAVYWSNTNVAGDVTVANLSADHITINTGSITVGTSTQNSYLTNSELRIGNSTAYTIQNILDFAVINGSVNATITSNSTTVYFTGTSYNANNTAYVGTVTAANVVSNAQLSANLTNYQTTAGLSANVATLTANNTAYVGTVTAANVVSNAQLQSNLSNYALLSGASFSGNVSVGGNLVVTGTLSIAGNTEYVNSTIIVTSDLNLILANGISSATLANGSGVVVGTYANLAYASAGAGWQSNVNFLPAANNLAMGNTTALWNVYANNIAGTLTTVSQPNITANNTSFVGSVSAANVVSNAQLQSNLSNYQTTAGLSANVATLTANNTNYVGTVSAANVVSNAQLQSNLSNYQTTAGLSANVATLTANNTTYVGSVTAANVVSNAQLQANLANYQTTSGISANVATLTANNTSFVGTVSAANVVSNAQLQSNLSNYAALSGATFTGAVVHANSLSLNNNQYLRFQTVNTSAYSYFVNQNDDNFVFYTTNASYGSRAITAIYANSSTSNYKMLVPTEFDSTIVAGGSNGSAGQILTSNGNSPPYWSTPSSGSGSGVNTNQSYTWANVQTFSANVSFTGYGISLNNGNLIYFNGLSDGNWKMGRDSGATTRWVYTNNTIDIITSNSQGEGFVIGQVSNNTYFETGYLGTYIRNNVTIGNSSSNATINSTAITANSITVGSPNTAVFYNINGQSNAGTGAFLSNAYAALGGSGGNYLAFGQQSNYHQWIQSGYSAASPAYYSIILNPVGGNVGIGNTAPTNKLSVNGTTYLQGNVTFTQGIVDSTGTQGTAGQVLTSNGSGNVYWSTISGVNTAAQYTWSNTQTFSNTITFSIGLSAASGFVVNTSQVTISNLPIYLGTQGEGAPGQVLTSNGAGLVPYWAYPSINTAAQYTWSNTQTFSNTITFSSNVAVNTAFSVNSVFAVNTSQISITQTPISLGAQGNGTPGQVLTSNGNGFPPYWSTISGGGSANVAAQYAWTNTQSFSNTITFNGSILANTVNAASYTVGTSFVANSSQVTLTAPLSSNGSTGLAGYVLTSNGSTGAPYWSAASVSTVANLAADYITIGIGYLTVGNSTVNSVVTNTTVTTSQYAYANSSNTQQAYTYFNASTNSLDTVFT